MKYSWHKGFLICLGMTLNFTIQAVTIDPTSFEMAPASSFSISKAEIENILRQVGLNTVNGHAFNPKDVQELFEDVREHYFWEHIEYEKKFKKKYGNSALAKLLYTVALGDFRIKQLEKRYTFLNIGRHQQVGLQLNFFETPTESNPPQYLPFILANHCVIDYHVSRQELTDCFHEEGNDGHLLPSDMIYSDPSFRNVPGHQRENTSCESRRRVYGVIEKRDAAGIPVLSEFSFEASHTARVWDQNIFFTSRLQGQASAQSLQAQIELGREVAQHSCENLPAINEQVIEANNQSSIADGARLARGLENGQFVQAADQTRAIQR